MWAVCAPWHSTQCSGVLEVPYVEICGFFYELQFSPPKKWEIKCWSCNGNLAIQQWHLSLILMALINVSEMTSTLPSHTPFLQNCGNVFWESGGFHLVCSCVVLSWNPLSKGCTAYVTWWRTWLPLVLCTFLQSLHQLPGISCSCSFRNSSWNFGSVSPVLEFWMLMAMNLLCVNHEQHEHT